MNQHKQVNVTIKIRTVVAIILAALLASVVSEIILAERTNALVGETLQDTTSAVTQVVSPITPSAPITVPNPSQPQSVAPNHKAAAAPAAPTPAPLGSTPSPSHSPTTLISTDLQKIYFSKAKMPTSLKGSKQVASVETTDTSSSFAWLRATEHGWKVIGVLWYWWMMGTIIVIMSAMIWQRSLSPYLLNRWLSKQYILLS